MPGINENNKKVKSEPTGCCCCCFSKTRSKKMFDETTNSVDQTVSDFGSSTSIQSETVPYSSPVSNLKPGNVIRIQGMAHQGCSRFSVDFLSVKSDIAFHLNPRLSQKYIVRNSRLNGRWGAEETTSIHKFSFERNKIFKLDIFCTEREFLISLNGKYICAFVYRVPLPSITTIEIRGLVEVYGVDVGEAQAYPETAPENVPIIASVGAEQTIIGQQQEMEIPATRLLPDGFLPGWQLEIYGRVKLLPHSFYINLQEGYQMWPHPIVHLHLNPRFSITTGDRVFVRNAWLDGEWGREERVPLFQFAPGSPFVMTISRMDDHFAVWVDGKLTGEFKFRRNADKIDSVYIQGDITLTSIGLRRPTATGRSLTIIKGDGCICDDDAVPDTEDCTCTDSNTLVTTAGDCTCGDDNDNTDRTTNTTMYFDANDRNRRSDSNNTTVYTDADDRSHRQSDTSASVYTDAGDYTARHSDINATVFSDPGDHTVSHGDTSNNTTTNTSYSTTNTNTTNTTASNITNNTTHPDTIDTTNASTTHTTDTTNDTSATDTTNATNTTDTTDTTNANITAYSDKND